MRSSCQNGNLANRHALEKECENNLSADVQSSLSSLADIQQSEQLLLIRVTGGLSSRQQRVQQRHR